MNLYGSDLFGFPREWFSEERDDTDVFAPPRFWIVAPRLFLLPDDEDDDDDVDPFNREQHREGEEKEATKTLILFSHKHTHTRTLSLSLSLCVCVCRFLSENSLPRVTAVSALLYIISDEKRKKDILQRKRKESKKCTLIRVGDPKQKTAKNLSGRKFIDATRRDRLL